MSQSTLHGFFKPRAATQPSTTTHFQLSAIGGTAASAGKPFDAERGQCDYMRRKDDGTLESVAGYKYPFAGNIAHPNDRSVQMPDLEDLDMEDTELKRWLENGGLMTLKNEVVENLDHSDLQIRELLKGSGVLVESFVVQKGSPMELSVARIVYNDLDVHNEAKKQYELSKMAKALDGRAMQGVGRRPGETTVQYAMVRVWELDFK